MRSQNEKLLCLLRPVVQSLGYELLGAEHLGRSDGVVRLYIDSERGVNIGDCARVSEQARPALDTDHVYGDCTLEVSSPGIDRPLFTLEQAARWIGHAVEIRLLHTLEGRRRLRGVLLAVGEDCVCVDSDDERRDVLVCQIDRMRLVGAAPKPTDTRGATTPAGASAREQGPEATSVRGAVGASACEQRPEVSQHS